MAVKYSNPRYQKLIEDLGDDPQYTDQTGEDEVYEHLERQYEREQTDWATNDINF